MAKLGNLWFDLGLDTRQLDKAWGEAMKKYQAQGKFDTKLGSKKTLDGINAQNSALGTQHRLMQNIHTLAASYVSIFAAGRLVRELITVSGEFEMQRVSLQAILKDLDGANKIFDQIKELAVKSPFQFKDLISYTKQLSAFSIPMGELYDTTKMLSDVSAGLGVGMDRLVLAYGQIRAASVLRGQEVRQLTEAGIPVIEELRKKFEALGETGITAADVFDKISARLVPFSMIKEMFEDMTSAGGKFYKMQEIQAETLKGKVSNLKDAYQIMFSEIGEKGDKVLKGAVDLTRSAIDNYEKIGKTILDLVVIYGTYKAALIAINAVSRVNLMLLEQAVVQKHLAAMASINLSNAEAMAAARTTLFSASIKGLGASLKMIINPYVVLAAAIAGLAYVTYKAVTADTALERAQDKLNKTLKDSKEKADGAMTNVEGLTSVIRDGTKSILDQVSAFNELIKKYEFFKKYSIEDIQKMSAAEFASVMSQFGVISDSKSAQANYDKQKKLVDSLKEQLKASTTFDAKKGIYNVPSPDQLFQLNKSIKAEEIILGVYEKQIEKLKEKQELERVKGLPVSEQIAYYNTQKAILDKVVDDIERISPDARTLEQNIQLDEAKKKVVDFQNILGSLGGELATWEKNLNKYASSVSKFGEVITRKGDESTEDFLARLREDYENTTKLIASRSQLAGQDVSQLKERLSVLSGAFKAIGISPIEAKEGKVKPEKEQRDYRADLIELEKKLALDLAKARIDGMVEGFDKEMAQMDYEHQRRIEQIERQKRDLLEMQKKAGGSGEQLTPENAALVGGLVSSEVNRYKTQTNQFYKVQLDKYRTYQEQRNDVDEWYTKEQEALLESSASISAAQLESKLEVMAKTYKDKMKEINDAELNELMKHSTLLVRIFGDTANMSRKRLKENIASAKQLLAYITRQEGAVLPKGIKPEDAEKMIGDYEAIRKLQKTIYEMEEQSQKIGDYPLSGFVKGFMNLEKQAELSKEAIKAVTEEERELAQNLIDAEKTKAVKNFGAGIEQVGGLISKAAEEMQKFAEIAGSEKLSEAADKMSSFGGVISAFGQGVATTGNWWAGLANAAISMITQTIEAFANAAAEEAEYQQNQLDYLNEYHNMLLKIKAEDYESIFGVEVFRRSADAIRNAKEALSAYNDELRKRTAPEKVMEQRSIGIANFSGAIGGIWTKDVISKESKLALDAYKKGYSDIQRMAIKTKDQSGWANFFGAKDEFKTLYDIAPEMWGGKLGGEFNVNAAKVFLETNTQITEEQRKQIQNLITQKELYDENVNIIKEDLKDTFGGMGDAMVDSIVRGMTEGADSWELFKDAGELAIEKLGEKLMYELFFAKRFKKYGEDLMAVYDDETLTPEEIAAEQLRITDEYMGVFQQDQEAAKKWAEMYKESAKERGYDVWDSADSNSLGKSIQAAQMTENTANLIASYINAIRADSSKKSMMMEKITPMVGNINDTLSNSLTHLAAINSNTLRSANGVDRLVEKIDALTTPNGATRLNTVVRTS